MGDSEDSFLTIEVGADGGIHIDTWSTGVGSAATLVLADVLKEAADITRQSTAGSIEPPTGKAKTLTDLEVRYLRAASLLSGVTVIGPNSDGFSTRAAILDPDEAWKAERDKVMADPLVAKHIDPNEFQMDVESIAEQGGATS